MAEPAADADVIDTNGCMAEPAADADVIDTSG